MRPRFRSRPFSVAPSRQIVTVWLARPQGCRNRLPPRNNASRASLPRIPALYSEPRNSSASGTRVPKNWFRP
eukprot:8289497-Lingulodinium_polyedra.AAC.1